MKAKKQINNFKAAIFDMDGVLIDSMMHWIEADVSFLRTHNIELTNEMIKYFSGRSERENMEWIKNEFKLLHTVDELLSVRNVSTDRIYTHQTNLLPGVENLLQKIKIAGHKIALASGAPLRQIMIAADRFGWHQYFDEFVSPDNLDHVGKPDPRIYLHTAERLGIAPAQCVVFEDAENGVVAAKRAGMYCVAIPDKRWSPGDFSQADLIVKSLGDERISQLLKLSR